MADAKLTAAEQRLADVVARRYPEAALLSAHALATAAEVSPASVTRFAKKLGYHDFNDLQTNLAVEMRARLSTPPGRLTASPPGRHKTTIELLREVIARDRDNLNATLAMLDAELLESLRDRLARTPRSSIYIVGSKKGGVVAAYFAMQLRQVRSRVFLLELNDRTSDQVLDMTADDLLVIFEPRRATAALVRLITECRALGMSVASFTDENPPAVIAKSEYLFRTKVDAVSILDSYAAMFALCDALLAALVQRNLASMRARTDRLEALNVAFDTWNQKTPQDVKRRGK
ncbi:MAG: MurR/RpiR family transcriptional regulator [Actinomycetia bacterium]|nr:MurR/RpiR family transcriptional regulator [Actinomycetes bacterium]